MNKSQYVINAEFWVLYVINSEFWVHREVMYLKQNRVSISASVLKSIAYLSMLIDHYFAVVFYKQIDWMASRGNSVSGANIIYRVGRSIGKPAFILFAFMVAEGFIHTRSRTKYLLRLFIFALLSEIPFDLAISGSVASFDKQNVFFTLFLGVLALCLMDHAKGHPILQALSVLACGISASFLNTDYAIMGVFLVVTFYLCRKDFVMQFMVCSFVIYFGIILIDVYQNWGYGYSLIQHMNFGMRELYGLAAFLPIYFYNGKKGRQLPKLCYYMFYPVHLFILYGIGQLFVY